MTDRVMTQKQIAAMVKKIERHKAALGKHRDALRDIIDDVEGVCDEAADARDNLQYAVDALSKYL